MRHHSQDRFFRSPLGAQACGTEVRIRFEADMGTDEVLLRLWQEGETLVAMQPAQTGRNGNWYETTLLLPDHPCQLWYSFRIRMGDRWLSYGNAPDNLGGEGCLWEGEAPSFQITVYAPDFRPPEFLRQGICYQIFPDRYAAGPEKDRLLAGKAGITVHSDWNEQPLLHIDPVSGDNRADDYFGGNLFALAEHLKELKEYGISVLYLNPIFEASSNHRYNTSDYRHVDPLLGGDEALDHLLRTASALGIRVLLDGVFSHTGDDSVYFNRYGRYPGTGAYQSKDSPYYSWFVFRHFPDDYECWWNIPTLPQCNKLDPGYQAFFLNEKDGILPSYVRRGTAGWRLDVADEIDDTVLAAMRSSVKSADPDAALIGEVWEDATNKISYGKLRTYALGTELDGAMNYPLREIMIGFLTGRETMEKTLRRLRSLKENYPPDFLYSCMNLMGSHDRARILSVLGGEDGENMTREEMGRFALTPENRRRGKARLLLFWAFLCCFPGMPTLYYGDECGMEGLKDPFNRETYPWGREDLALKDTIGSWIRVRKENPVLTQADWNIGALGEDLLALERTGGQAGHFLLLLNRAEEEREIHPVQLGIPGGERMVLPPLAAVLFRDGKRIR